MAKFNEKEVKEINAIISDIQKAIDTMKSPKIKIGAREKATVLALFKASSLATANRKFFQCRREHSDAIVTHFVVDKGMKRSKFSMSTQQNVYIIDGEGD